MNIRDRSFRSLAVFALMLVVACVQAQTTKPAATKHSLWKVAGKENAVYLVGSVHVLKKENYPLAAPIEAAFTNSQIVVFETDLEAIEKPELAMKMMAKGKLPEGETLKQQLSAPVYASFSNHLAQAGMQVQFFEPLSPAMAALTLVVLELKKLDLDPEYGLDKHFFGLAKGSGKKIVPLESVDFQIGLMTEFTKEEGELLMKTTLEDIDTMEKDLADLLAAWQTGDSEKLQKLLNQAMESAPVIYKRLVTDRNWNWIPKIEELSKGKANAIVIVGAGHLVGTNGVVALLKSKGYKVEQQ